MDDPEPTIEAETKRPFPLPLLRHYYGDVVRSLFLAAGVILLLSALFSGGSVATIVIALALALFAGLTNPKQFWIAVGNVLISIIGLFTFGLAALNGYRGEVGLVPLLTTGALGVIFFFALYYSAKTLRGRIVK